MLGCAERYTAAVHWRGGAQSFVSESEMAGVTSCSWSRTLNDVSDAQVVVVKGGAGSDCCSSLAQVEPWVHELSIYRDGDLVWQGPVTKVTENRTSIVVDAQDVFAWLDKLLNTTLIRYVDASGPDGRYRAPVTHIAWNILRLNLIDALSVPSDYPKVLDYIVRRDPDEKVRFEKDGTNNKAIWNAFVGDIWRELVKRGLTWTAVGRSLLLRGRPTQTTDALARLELDHILGDVEVIKDGAGAATYGWATTQQEQDIEDGLTVGTGQVGTPYGRLDTLVKVQGQETSAEDLLQTAREAIAGRYPVPVTFSLPDGSRLSPLAPVGVQDLVPGERFDVLAGDFCMPVAQGFALTDVEAKWGGDGGEEISVTLVPLANVVEAVSL